MSLIERQRHALSNIRQLLRSFLAERLSAADFIPQYGALFAPFDPPDPETSDLTAGEKSELAIFIQIKGGWFGEDVDLIPKRSDWEYGVNTEPYSWIDGPAYRRWIHERLASAGVTL